MSLFSRIALGLGAFLILTGIAYTVRTYEWEGVTLMITVAVGALLVGLYLVLMTRRARATLAEQQGAGSGAADEPHVGPTIWPLVFALSAVGLLVGAVAAPWALVPGGVLFVVAGVGWALDIRHQWHHHPSAAPHDVAEDPAGEPHPG